jgi:hypothetical protein
MGVIADIKSSIKSHGGYRNTKFNQAIRFYIQSGRAVPAGMRADPEAYAHLTKAYVLWTLDRLSALKAISDHDQALEPAAARLLGLVCTYFHQPDIWPRVDEGFDDPLRLVIPACYALRVLRAADGLSIRILTAADLGDAGAFAHEVFGRAADQVKRKAAKDAVPLAAHALKPSEAAESTQVETAAFLDDPWRTRLEAAREAGRRLPSLPAHPPPAPAQPSPPSVILPETQQDPQLIGGWVYSDWVFPGSYGGGSIRVDTHWYFGSDGRFAKCRASAASFTGWHGEVDSLIREGAIMPRDRGKWETGGNRLTVRWDTGETSVYGYAVGPRTLVTDPDTPSMRKEWRRLS